MDMWFATKKQLSTLGSIKSHITNMMVGVVQVRHQLPPSGAARGLPAGRAQHVGRCGGGRCVRWLARGIASTYESLEAVAAVDSGRCGAALWCKCRCQARGRAICSPAESDGRGPQWREGMFGNYRWGIVLGRCNAFGAGGWGGMYSCCIAEAHRTLTVLLRLLLSGLPIQDAVGVLSLPDQREHRERRQAAGDPQLPWREGTHHFNCGSRTPARTYHARTVVRSAALSHEFGTCSFSVRLTASATPSSHGRRSRMSLSLRALTLSSHPAPAR